MLKTIDYLYITPYTNWHLCITNTHPPSFVEESWLKLVGFGLPGTIGDRGLLELGQLHGSFRVIIYDLVLFGSFLVLGTNLVRFRLYFLQLLNVLVHFFAIFALMSFILYFSKT